LGFEIGIRQDVRMSTSAQFVAVPLLDLNEYPALFYAQLTPPLSFPASGAGAVKKIEARCRVGGALRLGSG